MKTTRLRVTMRDVVPQVVRVVDVPSGATLSELHWLLQAAIGWTNSHLHVFDTGTQRFGPDPEFEELYDDEDGVAMSALGTTYRYEYDFGDSWEHDVEVLGPGGDRPTLVDSTGDCPPEDCGGSPGYQELLTVLADPAHPEHARLTEWTATYGRRLDETARAQLLEDVAGVVPQSVRILLDLVGDGVRLTPGGRLPRALVRQVQEQRPSWYVMAGLDSHKLASIEEDLMPLVALHDMLRSVGLLRLSRGQLTVTRAGCDDAAVIRRLRACWEPSSFAPTLTALAIPELIVAGPMTAPSLAAAVHPRLDPRWRGSHGPVTLRELLDDLYRMSRVWQALDLIVAEPQRRAADEWRVGPSARSLLPQVAFAAAYADLT